MDEMMPEKFNCMNDVMEKIDPAFDKCFDIRGKEKYLNIDMLGLLSGTQTALEIVLFSLECEYRVMANEPENSFFEALHSENGVATDSKCNR